MTIAESNGNHHDLQKEQMTEAGPQMVRDAMRVMLAVPVRVAGQDPVKTAVLDFAIAADGTLSQVDLTPDTVEILRSGAREVLTPLSLLDGIKAFAELTPPPAGTIAATERGEDDRLRVRSREALPTALAPGAKVKLRGTRSYDNHYTVLSSDGTTFQVEAAFQDNEVGTWEVVPENRAAWSFDNMIVGVEQAADGRLRIVCPAHNPQGRGRGADLGHRGVGRHRPSDRGRCQQPELCARRHLRAGRGGEPQQGDAPRPAWMGMTGWGRKPGPAARKSNAQPGPHAVGLGAGRCGREPGTEPDQSGRRDGRAFAGDRQPHPHRRAAEQRDGGEPERSRDDPGWGVDALRRSHRLRRQAVGQSADQPVPQWRAGGAEAKSRKRSPATWEPVCWRSMAVMMRCACLSSRIHRGPDDGHVDAGRSGGVEQRGERGRKDLGILLVAGAGGRTLRFEAKIGGVVRAVQCTPDDIQAWHHYAGTYDGQMLRLYVDGALAGELACAGAIDAGSGPLFIGCKDTLPTPYFKGQIAGVELWSRARTAAEIAAQRARDDRPRRSRLGRVLAARQWHHLGPSADAAACDAAGQPAVDAGVCGAAEQCPRSRRAS